MLHVLKSLCWIVAILFVLSFGACASEPILTPKSVPEPAQPQPHEPLPPQPTSPQPKPQSSTEPPPEPKEKLTQESAEQEQLPEIMHWLKADVRDAYDAIFGLTSGLVKGRNFPLRDFNGTPTQYINTGTSGPNATIAMDATRFVKSMAYIENAYYLVEHNRLRDEAIPRDVTEKEILIEVEQAYEFLKLQIDYSVILMTDSIEWVKNYENPTAMTSNYIDKDSRIRLIIDHFGRYRRALSDILPQLERILSYGEPYLKTEE